MDEADSPEPLNPGHYFELLDRAHIACNYVDMAMGDHPVLKKHPELQAIYDEAIDRLSNLYQAVGACKETWE